MDQQRDTLRGIISSIVAANSAILSVERQGSRSHDENVPLELFELREDGCRRAWSWFERTTWFDQVDNIPDDKFVKEFKLDRSTFYTLAERMPSRAETVFRPSLPKDKRFAAALRYLTTGSLFKVVGEEFGMSESSAWNSLNEAVTMINGTIPFPSFTRGDLQSIQKGFEQDGGLPGTVGALDGCHIKITTSNPNQFYCYKQYPSILLLGKLPLHIIHPKVTTIVTIVILVYLLNSSLSFQLFVTVTSGLPTPTWGHPEGRETPRSSGNPGSRSTCARCFSRGNIWLLMGHLP